MRTLVAIPSNGAPPSRDAGRSRAGRTRARFDSPEACPLAWGPKRQGRSQFGTLHGVTIGRQRPLSEGILRKAARVCLNNAASHHDAAKRLLPSPQALALALIGVEEFAKAVIYTVAALRPEQRHLLPSRLDGHHLKHWVAGQVDGAHEVTSAWDSGSTYGYPASWFDRVADIFVSLAEPGLTELLTSNPRQADAAARAYYAKLDFGFPHSWSVADRREAALYVDVRADGTILTPDRVTYLAAGETAGLCWYLETFAVLADILDSDEAWAEFSTHVRQRLSSSTGETPAP